MTDHVWVFGRGEERLSIHRGDAPDGGTELVLRDNSGTRRCYSFQDAMALVAFQSDMESLLLRTGWTFMAFEPDRRSGRDRRTWPRIENDRRRWWTDSQPRPGARSSGRQRGLVGVQKPSVQHDLSNKTARTKKTARRS